MAYINNSEKQACFLGVDVGSTTVKCVLTSGSSPAIIYHHYQRHESSQAECLLHILDKALAHIPADAHQSLSVYITGSGAEPLIAPLGAVYVHEVNAVSIAVEKLHPEVNSVIELGGQDAKMVLYKTHPQTGERTIVTSMNDKCASGTGATIDKCIIKAGVDRKALADLVFDKGALHHVAAKCGVFAETDIINLMKSGIPGNEILNSLADAIVMQNLSVLARGNTLRPDILLLGGPNKHLPFLAQCWRYRIAQMWQEREIPFDHSRLNELIRVPENAELYAALGSILFGQSENTSAAFRGLAGLKEYITNGRRKKLGDIAGPPLLADSEDFEQVRRQYQVPAFKAKQFRHGDTIQAFVGLDGGSTSSKAVLIDPEGKLLYKQYRLSRGNPLEDTIALFRGFRQYAEDQGCNLEIQGMGVTGYAAEVIQSALQTDASIVETIAHMLSAQHHYGNNIDVICDIGGQDIKILFMQNGEVRHFRLSNQCSAGNGMLLQTMAGQFGIPLEDFAESAFRARLSPRFSYGCAVFLDADRVNFQKEGFSKEELFAGLAQVLPKNIWQYVVQIPRMEGLGRRFVLQGGTQYNLAAVKAQADYIKKRIPDADILVHPHCGEAGAQGAALEAIRIVGNRGYSTFIGLEDTLKLQYTTRTDESTRCTFCENECSRTFIDTRTPSGEQVRYIAGFSCEKGSVESTGELKTLNSARKSLKTRYPNLVDYESRLLFRHVLEQKPLPAAGTLVNDETVTRTLFGLGAIKRTPVSRGFERSATRDLLQRNNIRIAIPQVLNNYSLAPFYRAYLETLGIKPGNILFSGNTSEDILSAGSKYASVDPCFPAKAALAHVHHLLTHRKYRRRKPDYLWFPAVTHIPSFVSHTMDNVSCPVVAGAPKVALAAFSREKNCFDEAGLEYVDDALNFDDISLLKHQLYETWKDKLAITEDESDRACEQAMETLHEYDRALQEKGLEILRKAEQNNDIVLLMLGRPYHSDPGINHEILDEFQSLGYPVLSIRSIPKNREFLHPLFKTDLDKGLIADIFDINDVWPENFSSNSAQKVWAAKFAARHPNVVVLDLSSFKCGHDAPTYAIIEKILETAKTPFLNLHDIDANKPGGSIKIRVRTYAYTLERYRETLLQIQQKTNRLTKHIKTKRAELIRDMVHQGNTETAGDITDKRFVKTYMAYVDEPIKAGSESSENSDITCISNR
ncbi:MAG TPA: CoA activase [Gammaproteobacteria bacterium]|nr:CoA activase [Gammaproteobacteria bacterium]